MAKDYIKGVIIPKGIFDNANSIIKEGNLSHRMDGFRIMGNIQPTVLKIKKVRLPKSKEVILQVDVRHLFKL